MAAKAEKFKSTDSYDVCFKKARKKANRIDKEIREGNRSTESMKVHLQYGEHKVTVKITSTPTSIGIKSKDENCKYYDYGMCLESMLEGVLLAEGLQNDFNQRWVDGFREYLLENKPDHYFQNTDQELFEILDYSRKSES